MTETTPANTWGKAVALWFWTNVGGTLGMLLILDGALSIVRIIGLIAALISSPAILLAYPAFGWLLALPQRWLRLSCTALSIVLTVSITVLIASLLVATGSSTWWGAMTLGGWAYALTALLAAVVLYQSALLRPDDFTDPDAPTAPAS